MKELDLLRQELLSCDTQLVDILMKRFDVVEKIMALKVRRIRCRFFSRSRRADRKRHWT